MKCTEAPSSPQSITTNRGLPQLDRAVLTTCSVQLSIRAETGRPHGSVVSLAGLDLLLRIVIPNVHPSVRRTACDKSSRSTVQSDRRHLAVRLDVAEQLAWLRAREEVDVLACGDGHGAVRVVVQASVELARSGRRGELEGGDGAAGAQIVPA